MSRKYEVTAITGKYTDKNGQEKSRYQTIGAVIETKNGPMLKLEAVPIAWDGWAYLNEPKREEGERQPSRAARQPQRSAAPAGGGGFEDMDSDVPFANPLRSRGLCLAI